jgi:spermidine synthase
VLWARLASLQFGVSIFGVAATVSAFLLGLGAGAIGADRMASRQTPGRALRAYAGLEAAAAAFALLLPSVEGALQPWIDALAPQLALWQWMLLQGACALTILCLPAFALGAGFSFALRAMRAVTDDALGLMYGLNCLGAALGAWLALELLVVAGWNSAVRAAGGTGLLVGALAWVAARWLDARAPEDLDTGVSADGAPPLRGRVLLAYAAVGACALVLEVAWTRLFGVVFLRTEYVLAMLLGVFILGTAIGSLLERRAGALRRAPLLVPVLACAWTLAGLWLLPRMSMRFQEANLDSFQGALGVQFLMLVALALPVCAALGAWLPLLARQSGAPAGSSAGVMLYGANCVGGAAGAALTVAIGLPLAGSAACIAFAGVALLALGGALGGGRPAFVLCVPAAIIAWQLHAGPEPAALLPAAGGSQVLYRYEDAVTMNHVTQDDRGERVLLTDMQRMDASTDPSAVRIQSDQARLALLLHPHPRSILFLGLGTGISVAGSLAYEGLGRTAVEISPGAIQSACTLFRAINRDACDHTRIVRDDARHFLVAGEERYDVIVGDLFHPDLAGMGVLLSLEQFARVRSRLAPGGVFVQWLALNQFDRESLHTVLRGFRQVFPGAHQYLDGLHLALVGSNAPLSGAGAMREQRRDGGEAFELRSTGGEGHATWLGRYWGPVAGGIGPVQSEWRPVLEFRLARLHYAGEVPLAGVIGELLRQRPLAAQAADELGIDAQERREFLDAYAASELAAQAWLARVQDDGAQSAAMVRLAYESNPRDRWIRADLADELLGEATRDRTIDDPEVLARILRVDPDQVECLARAWRLARASGRAQDAQDAMRHLEKIAPLQAQALR